jgi:hypothetical protein
MKGSLPKRKGLAVGIILLFICPSGISISQVKDKFLSTHNGGLIDKLDIECHGIFPVDIPLSILGYPVYYTRVEITNNNNITLSIDEYIKIETRAGRILLEYDRPAYSIDPHSDVQTQMFVRNTWHKYFHYTFGFFDLTIDYNIIEDGSHTKLLFHGFVFGCGAVILNPHGEKIEST